MVWLFFLKPQASAVLQPLSADRMLRTCYMGSLCLRKSLIQDESNTIFQEKYCSLLALGLFAWFGCFFLIYYWQLLDMGQQSRWMFHRLQYKHSNVHMNYCWICKLAPNSHWRSSHQIPQIIQWCIPPWNLFWFWLNISWVTWKFMARFLKLHINTFF